MPASTTLTVRLSTETKARLDLLASKTGRSSSFLAGKAIAGYVKHELEIVARIEQAIEDVRAGRVIPHEDVVAEALAIIESARTKT